MGTGVGGRLGRIGVCCRLGRMGVCCRLGGVEVGVGRRLRGVGVGGFFGFAVFAGQELEVPLFVLFPFPALVEDSGKADDDQQGDQEDHGVEVGAVGFHFGPFVPAGGQADNGGYDDQEAEGDAYEELAE